MNKKDERSLRDWFAGKALPEVIVIQERVTSGRDVSYEDGLRATARQCYEIADAMMKERKVGRG